ncbi:NAD(P)/FAD-dependent oxidoreductase [Fodinicola acaciae]|uniref:NAD(P)/FAD-dependent oxidoreductase n=1 Tax=Fodinicola acaciae TaxID=2681555 RepID=UPI0013D44CFD|nr:FAD-binding oxidoreductase [Fodinicola acaciae]
MADTVIVGGGAIGCATAVYLLRDEPSRDVVVLEPDPTYAKAATPRASGGVRQLFSCPENIALSRYTLEVTKTDTWHRNGYLFIASVADTDALRANFETQLAMDVRAEWLEPAHLAERFPLLATDDLGAAVLSADDGWLDPHTFLMRLRSEAESLGARFLRDRAVDFAFKGRLVSEVVLASGDRLPAEHVVNAAGCWSPELAARAGVPIPVEPMRRYEHFVEADGDFGALPFVKDPAGLALRPEGAGLSVGLVDFGHPGGFDETIDSSYFDKVVWPALAHRVPALDRARLRSTTVGHYDQNRLDGNAIIGNWPQARENFYLASGFSGHGLMHAPGVGRALSELIAYGEFRTIDLGRLGYGRIVKNQPYAERGIR